MRTTRWGCPAGWTDAAREPAPGRPPLRPGAEGPDRRGIHAGGVLTSRAGPGQDLFVLPAGDSLAPASGAPRLLRPVGRDGR